MRRLYPLLSSLTGAPLTALSTGRLIHPLASGVSDSMNIRASRSFALATFAAALLAITCGRVTGRYTR